MIDCGESRGLATSQAAVASAADPRSTQSVMLRQRQFAGEFASGASLYNTGHGGKFRLHRDLLGRDGLGRSVSTTSPQARGCACSAGSSSSTSPPRQGQLARGLARMIRSALLRAPRLRPAPLKRLVPSYGGSSKKNTVTQILHLHRRPVHGPARRRADRRVACVFAQAQPPPHDSTSATALPGFPAVHRCPTIYVRALRGTKRDTGPPSWRSALTRNLAMRHGAIPTATSRTRGTAGDRDVNGDDTTRDTYHADPRPLLRLAASWTSKLLNDLDIKAHGHAAKSWAGCSPCRREPFLLGALPRLQDRSRRRLAAITASPITRRRAPG